MAYGEKRGKYWRVRYQAPDGSWPSASRDDFGNRFTSRREAEAYGDALETDARRGQFIHRGHGRITVGDWAQKWLPDLDVAALTRRDYRTRLNAVVLPRWGDVAIGDITELAVRKWEQKLREEGYAANSISGYLGLLRTMLDDAVADRLIAANPVPARQRARRRGKFTKPVQPEYVVPTPRQALFVARNGLEVRGLSTYALVLTSFYTGLRIGELVGLRRTCLRLDGILGDSTPRLVLSHQVQYVDGELQLLPAKYDSGRGLVINGGLAELLAVVAAQGAGPWLFTAPQGGSIAAAGEFYGSTWHPIVSGRPSLPVVRGRRAVPGVRPVLGVEGMTPHGLRHGHKVVLDEGGHPRVAVEERMGHTLQGVEGTYSHTTPAMERRIADQLEEVWREAMRPHLRERGYGEVPPLTEGRQFVSQKSPRKGRKPAKPPTSKPWL